MSQRYFVTGATGFIGNAIVHELVRGGHQVFGLVRSGPNAALLAEAGATPVLGSLQDLEVLRRGAESADAVIHTAFQHDFAKFAQSCAIDQRAIAALGEVLAGSRRSLVVTSGTPIYAGRVITEVERGDRSNPVSVLRAPAEDLALGFVERGVRASVVRLPRCVHGGSDQGWKSGLLTPLTAIARQTGVVAYIGDGTQRWPAVHRLDAARLYCLAAERAPAGVRLHAVDEEGIQLRLIAEHLGAKLGLPAVSRSRAEAPAHYGFLAATVSTDQPASSARTREILGWQPREIGLLADLDANGEG